MFNLVKKFSLFGITGAGVATPIAYEGATSPYFDTLWRRSLNSSILIGECTAEEDGLEQDYKIYVSLEGEKKFDRGLGLKIFATVSSDVIWEGKEAQEERLYVGWNLKENSSGDIEFSLIPVYGEQVKWEGEKCLLKNIQKKSASHSAIEDNKEIKSEEIKFQCNETSIKKGFGWAECEVLFSPESNLHWTDGFKPKLTFSVF